MHRGGAFLLPVAQFLISSLCLSSCIQLAAGADSKDAENAATTFSGLVVAPTGQAVDNAQVMLLNKQRSFVRIRPDATAQSFDPLMRVKTDADGSFKLSPSSDAQSILVIHDLGVGQAPTAGWTHSTTIRLRAWSPARGSMLINNAPAANQTIMAGQVKLHGSPWPLQLEKFEVNTDAQGNFSFDRLPPGEVTLSWKIAMGARSYTFSHQKRFVVDQAFATPLDYHLRGRAIRGEFIAPEGKFDWNAQFVFGHLFAKQAPLSEFTPLGVPASGTHFAITLDNAGHFEATAIPPGEYRVNIRAHHQDDSTKMIQTRLVVPQGLGPIDLGRITATNAVDK